MSEIVYKGKLMDEETFAKLAGADLAAINERLSVFGRSGSVNTVFVGDSIKRHVRRGDHQQHSRAA